MKCVLWWVTLTLGLACVGRVGYLTAVEWFGQYPIVVRLSGELDSDQFTLLGIILAGGGLGLFASRTDWRRVKLVGGIGVLVGVLGFVSWEWSEWVIADYNAKRPLSGPAESLPFKPDLSKTILGYHFTTPIEGGPVMYADGAVWSAITKEEFIAAIKATPPSDAWKSPVRAAEPPKENDPNELDAMRTVRLAGERITLSNDLKQLAGVYHAYTRANGQPPKSPDDIASWLSPQLKEKLNDGTYVVLFGWSLLPDGFKFKGNPDVARLEIWNWGSLLVCVFALATIGYAVVVVVRTKLIGRQAVRSSAS